MRKITLLFVLIACATGVYAQSSRTARPVKANISALKNYIPVSPAAVIFTDNMDADNTVAGLTGRGYTTYFRGTGGAGLLPEWVQGDPTVFLAYNGPDSGYVGSSYNSITGANDLDNWLCLPAQNLVVGDSFSFWAAAPDQSTFPDSIRVMYNPSGATLPEDTNWVQIDNFFVNPNGTFEYHAYAVPTASATGVIAIRHAVTDAGPSGNNSDFIGIDQIDVYNSVAGPVGTFDTCTYAIDITSSFGSAIGVVNSVGPYDNTTATTTGDDPTTGWECFGEPDGTASAPELNNTVWFSFVGDGNNYFVESGDCTPPVGSYFDDGDTQFALYTGTCGNLTPYKCNEDGPSATATTYPAGFQFGTVAGVTYYLMVDGFNATALGGGVSNGEFCLKISQVASVACSSPTVTSGTSSQNTTFLCDGDTLTVSTTGAISPTTGNFYGISWIISTADISGSTDPLNDPSLVASYSFSSPVPATSTRQFINDGTAAFIVPGTTYYWTPVVFGNAVQASAGAPVFLGDLTLDASCTYTGTSLMVNVLNPTDPQCLVGINENNNSFSAINAYPSPAKDVLTIEFSSTVKQNSVVEITDVTGRVVFTQNATVSTGVNKIQMNVNTLASGSYIVSVKGDSTRQVKFVKQ